jgi:hypothetical protein
MAKITLATGLTYQFIDPLFTVEQLATMNALITQSLTYGLDKSPLHRWLGFMFGNCRMTKAAAIALLPLGPGDPSPFFETLDNLTQEGASVERGNVYTDTAVITAELPAWLDASQMALLYAAGGDIADEPVYFQVADLTVEVPASFPERLMEDGVTVHTWATWGIAEENHHPVTLGGTIYRSSQYGYGGVNLKASEWVPFLLAGGTVLNSYQYKAVLAANQGTP